jgi:hypothetical protein
VDIVDVECFLSTNRGTKEGQVQNEIGWHRGMQCVLRSSTRIFSEAIQTTESCTLCHLREGAKMMAARESFQEFVGEAGCTQPHRQIRRKVDNLVVPLILLPMNTTKVDVFHLVNEEVKKMVDSEPLSLASFHRMWRTDFSHVQIPPYSRFSKYYHCWEYKCGMEATTNAAARAEIKKLFLLYIRHQMEERRDYWLFKKSAMITPDFFMCLIVDGMDQNMTMVPKDEADGEEYRVLICENTFVQDTCTWDWLVCGCVDRCTPQAR